jgi:hypothetical protein
MLIDTFMVRNFSLIVNSSKFQGTIGDGQGILSGLTPMLHKKDDRMAENLGKFKCCERTVITLAPDRLKQLAAFFDVIMNAALQCVGLSKNKLAIAYT